MEAEPVLMEQPEALLHCFLDLGEALLEAGADVNRTEDTLTRLGAAYGAVRMNVFVITSSIVVTMSLPDGRDVTQTRRILSPGGTDLTRLEELNALSRRCCVCPLSVKRFSDQLAELTRKTPHPFGIYLGSALAAGSCAVFFGGTFADGLSAAAFGLAICLLQRRLSAICPNRLMFDLLAALAVGISVTLWGALFPGLHTDKIMIGGIMLLIPGIAMTNAVRDMMLGSTISGAMRLIETLLWAGALAAGFMTGFWLMGRFGL